MQFGILGPIEVRRADGSPIAVGGPQVRSLLALLLMDAGRTISPERLIDGLYGDNPPGDAAHALQSQVSRLRRGLRNGAGPSELVEFGPAGYRLAIDPDAVDAHRFARLADAGRELLRGGDPAAAAILLDEALALWRGPVLADVLDAPFAEAQAARLTEARLAAVEDRADAALALGEHHPVAAELADLVAAHPLRERARALLMRGLYAAGRQAQALAAFEDGRRLLADELGADPSAELAEAHLAILRADAAATPATRRLPAQLTSFVGRDDELRRLPPLLAQSRLVSLIGPGGTGKTRLALEAGNRVRGEVCFVDLAALTDGAQVAHAFAVALGGRDTASTAAAADAEARVRAMLADRRVLIIVDNCEHVVADAARLTHLLLRTCPGLRVLATSREPLGITGETVFPVGQLAVAAPETDLTTALDCAAIRLFTDRAAAAAPGFAVDAGTIDAVRRICTRLDGLPLAIELAAARLRSLGLDEVDARLDDRFRLLSRGERIASPRHRTLRAVVEWSWDLLDPAEQQLAERFSVFAGGATIADAGQVCDVPDTDELLTSLADKSLVVSVEGRYRMLETIREFAARRLVDAGAQQRFRHAHAEFFAALAERADPELRGAEQLDWLARLTAEHANLQAALHWAVRADPAVALRLIAAQSWFWWLSGLRGDATQLAADLLPTLDSSAPAEEYALCAAAAARAVDGAQIPLDRVTAELARLEKPLRRPHLVFLLAIAGGPIDTEQHPLPFGPDLWSQSFVRLGEGLRLLMNSRTLDAETEFTSALHDFRTVGDRWAIAAALDKLAAIADWRGEQARSLAMMDEAIVLTTELGTVEDTADLLNRRGDVHAREDDSHAAARADYLRAAELAHAVGASDMFANAQRGLGDIARFNGEPQQARAHYSTGLARCPSDSFGAIEARARILVGFGWTAVADGDVAAALSSHRQALEIALGSGQLPTAASAVEGLAGVALLTENAERAAVLLGGGAALRGVALANDPDVARTTAAARNTLSDQRFDAAYRRGSGMTREEVLALAGR
ncbi:BTAD domain-containing putative transcriptional regulator [Nocardia sp. CA-107356]|uniref:BTAD domain-containing putative transcriptional regulator n=1 Tax=Nocardia sp. CA-107356 TaxID=3239972 RepID=UPI003D8AEAC2